MADQLTKEEVLEGFIKVFSPKAKAKKEKCNRVLTINGLIAPELVSMKQAKKVAKRLATTDAVVQVYKLEGELTADLEVVVNGGAE